MLDEIIRQSVLFVVSFAANLMASVSGGGAGFIQFPLLILLGLPFAAALGTHKVAVVFLGIGAMLGKKKSPVRPRGLDRTVSAIMLFVGCPAVVLGSVIIVRVPAHAAELVLGIITIACGVYTFFKKGFGEPVQGDRSVLRNLTGAALIFLVGLFSGSLSSGAGLFATLVMVGVFRLDLKSSILHSMIFVATLWNAVGAFTIGSMAPIHWQWLPVMIIATLLGSSLGTVLLIKLPVRTVKVSHSGLRGNQRERQPCCHFRCMKSRMRGRGMSLTAVPGK